MFETMDFFCYNKLNLNVKRNSISINNSQINKNYFYIIENYLLMNQKKILYVCLVFEMALSDQDYKSNSTCC